MEKQVLIFDKQCINKDSFYKNKRPISIDRVETRIIVLPKKDLYGKKGSFKYFIGYIHEGNVFPILLCIKLPQMNGYVKYFDRNNKCINLLVYDKELLKKYNEIWDKLSNLLKKEFDLKPVRDNKYFKIKIKIYNNRINTNFHSNEIPEDNECCAFLSVILLDSVVIVNKKYYPQIFLEECKYAVKEKK